MVAARRVTEDPMITGTRTRVFASYPRLRMFTMKTDNFRKD